MTTRTSRSARPLLVALLFLGLGGPAFAAVVPCEGRCEDGAGNVMAIENRCDDVAERCVAGCDRSGARPQPYAECEPTGRAVVPPPPPAENPGGDRVRDGE